MPSITIISMNDCLNRITQPMNRAKSTSIPVFDLCFSSEMLQATLLGSVVALLTDSQDLQAKSVRLSCPDMIGYWVRWGQPVSSKSRQPRVWAAYPQDKHRSTTVLTNQKKKDLHNLWNIVQHNCYINPCERQSTQLQVNTPVVVL